MPDCIVMVGLPGIGKSKKVQKYFDIMDSSAFIYSTDDYLESIAMQNNSTYDEVFRDNIKNAQKEMNIQLAESIKNRRDIIWDQTNLGLKKRRTIITRMKQAKYKVDCFCFLPPENKDDIVEWKNRLANRSNKTISESILTSMQKQYIIPTINEGFDSIVYFNLYGEILREENEHI